MRSQPSDRAGSAALVLGERDRVGRSRLIACLVVGRHVVPDGGETSWCDWSLVLMPESVGWMTCHVGSVGAPVEAGIRRGTCRSDDAPREVRLSGWCRSTSPCGSGSRASSAWVVSRMIPSCGLSVPGLPPSPSCGILP